MSELAVTGLRTPDRGQADELLALWNRSAEYDLLNPGLLQEKVWDDPGCRPELTLACSSGTRPIAFGMGVIRSAPEGLRGYVKLLAVDPEHRRRGLGSTLLTALEARLQQLGAQQLRIAEGAPNYLTPGVDLRYRAAHGFFDHHGYRHAGEACNMRADLSGRDFDTRREEERLAARGISVRRASPADRPALLRLLEHFGGSWAQEVQVSLGQQPARVHLALRAGEAVAFSASESNNLGTGWFGPMGTLPETRGLGIGQVLLRRCLADLQASGADAAIIPWVGPTGFYEQHVGARIERRFQRYEKDCPE